MTKIPQKSEYARLLLTALDREEFEFRVFPDAKGTPPTSPQTPFMRFIGPLARHQNALRIHNDQGCGVFVQIGQADGAGFKASNIVNMPLLFVDLDGAPKANLDRLGIVPHLVFETSPGKYHAYWRVRDIPLVDFKRIQQRLARLIDGDRSVVDPSRVMRLPGFLHMKNPNEPWLVKPADEFGDTGEIPFGEFAKALADAEERHGIVVQTKAANPRPALAANISRTLSAIRHLESVAEIDLSAYQDWIEVGMALKHSHGEEGWNLWHELSAEAGNYEGEESCRTKWNTFDKADGPQLTIATILKRAKESGWQYQGSKRDGKKEKEPAPAVLALMLCKADGDTYWLDLEDRPCATFCATPDGPEIHALIAGKKYQERLRVRYHAEYPMRVLSKEQLAHAVGLATADAHDSERHPAYLRSGHHEGCLYISLGRTDGKVVEVRPDGWSIVDKAPVRFMHRGDAQGELPLPKVGGSLELFQKHFNLDAFDVVKQVGVLVGALYGLPSYPINLIEGEQGTSKSTLGDMIISLVDPVSERKRARSSFPSDLRDLAVRAAGCHMPFFDNLSIVSRDASDALCRLATGGSFSTRELYTNDGEHVMSALRPVVATSIGAPTSRGDFLDRCVTVRTRTVAARRTETSVWRSFEGDQPQLFGFLLDLLAEVLRNIEAVQRKIEAGELRVPRLADFAAAVEAAAGLLGLKLGEFSAQLIDAQQRIQADAALGNPVIVAIVDHFNDPAATNLEGTAREILHGFSKQLDRLPKDWPAPNQLKRLLMRNVDGLRSLGVGVETIDPAGHANVCRYRFVRLDNHVATGPKITSHF